MRQERQWRHLPRLYTDSQLGTAASVPLDMSSAHYLQHVLRLKLGDQILLFNGKDGEWRAELTQQKKSLHAFCHDRTREQSSHPALTLIFSPIKREHMDFLLQKACELGVGTLVPMITQHTVMRTIKAERVHLILKEAAEQSERLSFPVLHSPLSFDKIVLLYAESHHIFACLESHATRPIAEALSQYSQTKPPAFLIGPEGGFSNDEIALLSAHPQITCVTLGAEILRADTAALAALSCWQALCGNWRQTDMVVS